MYQTLKYFLVRLGISLFLLMVLGFMALYFLHEIALPGVQVNDTVLKWMLGIVCVFFGFVAYGMFGNHCFYKRLKEFEDISPDSHGKLVRSRFEKLIDFTYSSYFLPRKGQYLRTEVIPKYADYLLSTGAEGSEGLKIFLKAFLQNPNDSRFRAPLLAILGQSKNLTPVQIDLLLIMFEAEDSRDNVISSHLAGVFLEQKQFSPKTEKIFLREVENKSRQAEEIVEFVLPFLLKNQRSDAYALNFYLNALAFHPEQKEEIRDLIGRSYCRGHWKAVDPGLHEQCGAVFEHLEAGRKEHLKQMVKDETLAGTWEKVKLLTEEDFEHLNQLKVRLGLVKSGLGYLQEAIFWLGRSLEASMKRIGWLFLNGLAVFGSRSFRFKLVSISILMAILFASLGYQFLNARRSERPAPEFSVEKKPPQKEVARKPKVHTIQVAAVTTQKQADRMVRRLKKKGIKDLEVVKTKRRAGGYWYKIRLGQFDDKREAEQVAQRLMGNKTIQNYFILAMNKR